MTVCVYVCMCMYVCVCSSHLFAGVITRPLVSSTRCLFLTEFGALNTYCYIVFRVLAHLSKSNSRTVKDHKANRHFYKHKHAKWPPQNQLGGMGEHCPAAQRGPGQSPGH